ncbi:MAG: hypothetical protein BWY67_02153 [Bacteroidetes bacterium ADurb.Bin397]|nr:MAG: hypothetical protein BWY67_02153 [Bacteroidetes bacterium ADurb.Bin397]
MLKNSLVEVKSLVVFLVIHLPLRITPNSTFAFTSTSITVALSGRLNSVCERIISGINSGSLLHDTNRRTKTDTATNA